jgi:hypothetical protein
MRWTIKRTFGSAAAIGASIVVASCFASTGEAASPTWASQANRVCKAWTAKARAQLPAAPPKTPASAYQVSVKAVAIERAELVALAKIPNPPAVGVRALASVQTDIAEIAVGLADWRRGDKAGFTRVYDKWQSDFRPHAAFLAAGAKTCG